MGLNIRKATKKDLEIIDKLYVMNSIEEVKQQFPKRTKKSILNEFKEHEKSRKKSFLAELNQSNVIFVIAESEEKIVDFRRYDFENVSYQYTDIPKNVENFCSDMLKHYGLSFGEFDFIKNKKGEYVFLEVNPNSWLEFKSGHNITKDVAENLL